MNYLDNSATTNKKPFSVKFEAYKNLGKTNVNPGRSSYSLSLKMAEKIYRARQNICSFFGLSECENCVFTSGCTESLNLAIMGTLKKGGHIITTTNEHNSVLRTLNHLENNDDISFSLIEPNSNGCVNAKSIEEHIKENTYMVIVNHTSNVTGATCNIEEIGLMCKKHNLIFLVDGAQSAGHEKIDMEKHNISMLALAGHKGLYGYAGIGALLINKNVKIKPIKFGGTGTFSTSIVQPTDIPDGLEAGTCNYIGILCLNKGVEFVKKNQDKINKKIHNLSIMLFKELKKIDSISIYTNPIFLNAGVVSFVHKTKSSSEIASTLSKKNIFVRNGLHCAPLVHKHFDTQKNGMVRVSLSYFTKFSQIKNFVKALKKIV